MRITKPEQLYETNQIVPTRQLLQLAEKWGFEHRANGTSHHRCTHTKYPDVFFSIIAKTDRLSSQRDLADAMEKIAKRDAEKQQAIQSSFVAASADRLAALRAKLPPHITVELTKSGNIVLRDVQIPQLGVTLYSAEQDKMLESYLRYQFGDTKNAFYAELNKLRTKHDAQPVFDENGSFTGKIKHLVYGDEFALELPRYEEDILGVNFVARFDLYRNAIEMKDLEQLCRKEEILAKPFLGAVLVSHSEQRGERHNHVRIIDPVAKGLKLTFTTFSNQRVSGDGTRGRITDAELDSLAWKVDNAERRLNAVHQRRAQEPTPLSAVA